MVIHLEMEVAYRIDINGNDNSEDRANYELRNHDERSFKEDKFPLHQG